MIADNISYFMSLHPGLLMHETRNLRCRSFMHQFYYGHINVREIEGAIKNGQSRETEGAIKNGQSRETEGAIKNGQSRETEGAIKNGQSRETQGAIKNGQSRETQGAIKNDQSRETQGAINNGQSRETGTLGTQDTRRGQTKQNTHHNICWIPPYHHIDHTMTEL